MGPWCGRQMWQGCIPTLILLTAGSLRLSALSVADEPYHSGVPWVEPPVVAPPRMLGDAPSDAIVLFDGTDLSHWNGGQGWKVEDGAMVVGDAWISTKQKFGDFQMHIEWATPKPPSGKGQKRGNSGIYIMGRYELQVLDSYENPTYFDGQAGALYKQTPPAVNVMRPPGEWNSYDILWTAPRFTSAGELESPAYITVLHNGVGVLNHFEVKGRTGHNRAPKYEAHPARLPIGIQNKGQPVRYRNIWIRELHPPQVAEKAEPSERPGEPIQ